MYDYGFSEIFKELYSRLSNADSEIIDNLQKLEHYVNQETIIMLEQQDRINVLEREISMLRDNIESAESIIEDLEG